MTGSTKLTRWRYSKHRKLWWKKKNWKMSTEQAQFIGEVRFIFVYLET